MKRKMMEKAEVVAAVKDEEIAREREEHDALQHEKDQHISELEEDKLRGELAHKSNEIVNLLLSVSNKNETLMNIREDLRNIYSDVKWDPEARQSVLNLLRQIDSSIQSEGVLKRVEKEFDLVHDNFIKKVRAQYPELSTNELMMCAYIKMNLSTKEIAPLMNISVRGVETIRYRMRKKLGLDRNDNLSEFLMKL
jgi:DNA-binding CsgD family transcriptional regulator